MTAPEPAVAAPAVPGRRVAASAAVQRASQILLARQDRQGWWSGRSASDTTLEAEALLVTEVLRIRTPEATNAVAQQLRASQLADGRWTGNDESPGECAGPEAVGDLSASVLAYLALRLAGDSADAYHMAAAAGWIRDAGGVGAVGGLCRAWLAVFGLAEWSDVPVPAPELSFLPDRYAATRPATVALAIVGTLRSTRPLPLELSELRTGDPGGPRGTHRRVPTPAVAHSAALRRCGQWLVAWQHRSGLPAARRPSWPFSLVALYLLGYPLDHPVLAKGLSWLSAATGQPRQVAAARVPAVRLPPVLDTTLAVEALADAGLASDHTALVAAGSWLLLQRIEGPAHGLGPEPSGWSFGRDGFPVLADTARVLLALGRVRLPGLTGRPAIRNAIRWLTAMQSRDGSWSGSATVTAYVVRALATHDAAQTRAIRRGVVWLLRQQRLAGSWPAPPGEGQLGATTTVLAALIVAGVQPAKPPIRSAVGWLLSQQNADAGWAGAGRTAASEARATARVVAALLAAGGADTADAIDLGADWLVHAQQADGGWRDETRRVHGGPAGPGARPAGRSSARRRGALLPGLLLPVGALGRYVALGPADAACVGGVHAESTAAAAQAGTGSVGALTAAE